MPLAAPVNIAVPLESSTGSFRVTWTAVSGATFYELQEATTPDFSDATVAYSGPERGYNVIKGGNGTYYYRVRAGVA